jgi:basic membrane protein A and related proteins
MRFPIVAGFVGTLFYAATALSGAVSLDSTPKPAFLYGGPKDDGGWHQSVDLARTNLQSALQMDIPYVEAGAEADVRTLTENFIHQGHNVIVGDSARYATAFKDLADKYANVAFINISDDIVDAPRKPNLQSVYGRSYESQYVCGVVAGMTSKKANIGFIARQSSTITNWEINAYALGVRLKNPDATLHVVFTGDAGSEKERTAASALIDRGADVVGQSVDGPTPQIVAQERGVFATGHAVDLHEAAPNSALCSSVWVWDRYLNSEIKKIAAGNWQAEPDDQLLGMIRGGVDIACCSTAIAHLTMARVLDERDGILIHKKQVFTGPLSDNDDKERVPAGSVISDAELRAMDWYVKGVVIDR